MWARSSFEFLLWQHYNLYAIQWRPVCDMLSVRKRLFHHIAHRMRYSTAERDRLPQQSYAHFGLDGVFTNLRVEYLLPCGLQLQQQQLCPQWCDLELILYVPHLHSYSHLHRSQLSCYKYLKQRCSRSAKRRLQRLSTLGYHCRLFPGGSLRRAPYSSHFYVHRPKA